MALYGLSDKLVNWCGGSDSDADLPVKNDCLKVAGNFHYNVTLDQ